MVIELTPTTTADVDFVVSCESDQDASAFILPWTRGQHLAALNDADCAHLLIRDSANVQRLGFVMLFGANSPHRSIEFRRIVCATKGCGIGRAAVREVKRLTFRTLNAHRLWLDVKVKNARARHLYRTEGFVEEGVLRECLLEDGQFESLVIMSLLQSEYEG